MVRKKLIEILVKEIAARVRSHPIRVAIDGIDASGKTTFADDLVAPLVQMKRQVIRASIDGFHNPQSYRYRRGKDSPDGYYNDSFDHAALKTALLKPLGPNGSLQYRVAAYDYRNNTIVNSPYRKAPTDAILLFDGVFLLRPELVENWDLKIFVDIDFDQSIARAINRDMSVYGSERAVRERYVKRYIPGQQLYFAESTPKEKADIIVKNKHLAYPGLILKRAN